MAKNDLLPTADAGAPVEATEAAAKRTRVLAPRPVYMIVEGDDAAVQALADGIKSGALRVVATTRDQADVIAVLTSGAAGKTILSGEVK
jgi:hypothetical protein